MRSLEPLLPLVTITYVTSQPSLTSFATVPPAPNSESSGCAVTTSTRSILSLNGISSRFGTGGSEPRVPVAGHPRFKACSRPPLQQYRFRGRRAYNRAMSMAASGRVGVGVLLVLLAAVVLVPLLPGDPSAVRLAGVGALWWFAACSAPVVSAGTTCAFFC